MNTNSLHNIKKRSCSEFILPFNVPIFKVTLNYAFFMEKYSRYLHYLHQSQIRAQKQNEAGGGIGQ